MSRERSDVTVPPEVARALGMQQQLQQQPAWQRWGPLGLLVAGGGFLVGGTLLGIRRAAAREEDLDGGGRTPRPAAAARQRGGAARGLPTAPVALPGQPSATFSPAALAGKALLYGTALALGGTAVGCVAFCACNSVRSLDDVSPALQRIGAAAAGWLGVAPPAPFETDADFDDDGGGGGGDGAVPLPAAFAGSAASLPPEVAGFVRRQARARAAPAAAPAPSSRDAAPTSFLDATDAKYLTPAEAEWAAQFVRSIDGDLNSGARVRG